MSATGADEHPGTVPLLELALERENLLRALKRVRQNKGSSGVEGMTVDEMPDYLKREWPRLREEILTGAFKPQLVRRHLMDKPGGGKREFGIPTVLDRFIQPALLQVLQSIFDPTFSEHSHGFRPGRRAHDAVRQAQRYVQGGKRWVVDVGTHSSAADDLRVYVGSRRSGERVMRPLVRLLGRLRLRINPAKSSVDRALSRPFPGFTFWVSAGGRVRFRVSRRSLERMQDRVRQITGRNGGRSMVHVAQELRE